MADNGDNGDNGNDEGPFSQWARSENAKHDTTLSGMLKTAGNGIKNYAKSMVQGVKDVGASLAHVAGAHEVPAAPSGSSYQTAHQATSRTNAATRSALNSPAAPQHPVSHPGTHKTPMHAAVGNRGHATVHPPKPATAHTSPARHTRPQHATAKATGGTQHTHSSGSKAGAAAAKKTKTKKTKSKSKSKSKAK